MHSILAIAKKECIYLEKYATIRDDKKEVYEYVKLFLNRKRIRHIKSALAEVFLAAKYQSCWTHICRNVMKHIRAKDKKSVMEDLKKVYAASDRDEASDALYDFLAKYKKIYPKIIDILNDLDGLFTFYAFPKSIQRSIYTTNLIENFNKNLKRSIKAKEQFPNEDALDRYVCSYCIEYNQRCGQRIFRGFALAQAELLEMFDQCDRSQEVTQTC